MAECTEFYIFVWIHSKTKTKDENNQTNKKQAEKKNSAESNSVNKYFIMTISDENFENYVAEFSTALRKISAERWFDNQ